MKTASFLSFLFISFTLGLNAEVNVSAGFEPQTITQGEPSLYRIDFATENGQSTSFYNSSPPRIPAVDGLRFQYIGPSHETRIVNGRTSIRTSHLYRVVASQPGEYEVPAFSFESGSFRAEIPAASLQVIDRASSQTPDGTPSTRAAWLEIRLPRENLYVGETTPVGIRLFLNSRKVADASLRTDHPEKVGDAFSIGEFSSMSQSQISLDGLPVTVADWTVLLTPLKTGPQPLLFELPLAANLRGSNRRSSPFDSFFGPSPFRSMFNRDMIRAYSEDQEIEILPLPSANRPENFTGGIGNFQVEQTEVSSRSVQVGEPFLFSVDISGQGNFDRLEAPVFQSDPTQWRSYDPETSFTPRDNLGYAGVKSFTFTLIPRSESITKTPDFSFSYFNPETGEYETVDVPPTPIEVTPAPPGTTVRPEEKNDANPVEARRGPDLLPLKKIWSGGSPSALLPPYLSTAFWMVQALLLILVTAAYFVFRHQALLRDDPDYARRNRARRASRRFRLEADSSAKANQVAPFYQSACRALQESVGPFQAGEPESLTENNVTSILAERGYPVEILEETHHFFSAAESIQYGGRKAEAADLTKENQRLHELLKTLHARRSQRPLKSVAAQVLIILTLCVLAAPEMQASESNVESTVVANDSGGGKEGPITDPEKAEAVFAQALQAYGTENFEEAARYLESLLPVFSSPEVHYNLANTFYRLREYPQAILHYEKAFALDPTDPDIRANLDLTLEAASLEPQPEAALSVIGDRLTWKTWLWLLCLGFWGLTATLLLARPSRLALIWRNCLLTLFGLILIVSVLAQVPWISTADRAIILSPETPLRIAPTAGSPLETRLVAGTSVTAEESYSDYLRIRLEDGTQGWVLRSSVGKIR